MLQDVGQCPARDLNCVVAARLAESRYPGLGLCREYSCLCPVMDCPHGALGRDDHLMRKDPARNRGLDFELVAERTKV